MDVCDSRPVLVIERDGYTHVIEVPSGALCSEAHITIKADHRDGRVEYRALSVYYAGAGVYYEKGDPCPTVPR